MSSVVDYASDTESVAGRVPVYGWTAPGFEPVRTSFERNFAERRELGAACAAYVDGRPVVDLWGGFRDRARREPWARDTMVPVFSSTKGMASLAVAVAHSRGLFGYDTPVASYWPEFASTGKDGITVRQLLAHQAGLTAIDAPISLETARDLDALSVAIAPQRPALEPGTRHGYHGITIGFYEGKLVRRVDPLHRSLGRYFQEEVAAGLGLSFHIGLPPTVPDSCVPVRLFGLHGVRHTRSGRLVRIRRPSGQAWLRVHTESARLPPLGRSTREGHS